MDRKQYNSFHHNDSRVGSMTFFHLVTKLVIHRQPGVNMWWIIVVNSCPFKGSNYTILFDSFLNKDQLLKERICFY